MEEIGYLGSDGTLMSLGDIINWVKWSKMSRCQYQHMTFDEITGGVTEFTSQEAYNFAKSELKNLFLDE